MKRIPLLALLKKRYPDLDADDLYARIVCGEVFIAEERISDPKHLVPADSVPAFRVRRFVSRGGEKLEEAIRRLGIDVTGLIFVDAGASTGGFTDCLLSRGAAIVHAVDVGYNQLAYSLRKDPRVIVHERTNIMELEALNPVPDAAVADLSFRSLRGAASKILALTRLGWGLVLFKPQFERASGLLDGGDRTYPFDGVVRNNDERRHLLNELKKRLSEEGIATAAAIESPVPGRKKGNREIVLLIHQGDVAPPCFDPPT